MKLPKPLKKVMKKFEKQTDIAKLGITLIVIYGIYRLFKEMRWGIGSTTYLEGFTDKTFVFFRMNGCKHCEDMKPEWDKFKMSYKGSVELKEIEQSDMTPEQKEWVNGFPTLVLVENNAVVKTFDGATRTASEFQSFLDLNVKKV